MGRRAVLSFVAALPAGAILIGCGAFDEFDVVIQDSATVQGRTGQPFSPQFEGGFSGGLDLKSNSTFTNNDVDPDDVDAIFVKSVKIDESQPALENLKNVVESIDLYVEAAGLEKKKIASGSSFPGGGTASLMVDSTVNIKPYAVAPQMIVTAEIRLKQMPAFGFRITMTVTLLVDIDLLGA